MLLRMGSKSVASALQPALSASPARVPLPPALVRHQTYPAREQKQPKKHTCMLYINVVCGQHTAKHTRVSCRHQLRHCRQTATGNPLLGRTHDVWQEQVVVMRLRARVPRSSGHLGQQSTAPVTQCRAAVQQWCTCRAGLCTWNTCGAEEEQQCPGSAERSRLGEKSRLLYV